MYAHIVRKNVLLFTQITAMPCQQQLEYEIDGIMENI